MTLASSRTGGLISDISHMRYDERSEKHRNAGPITRNTSGTVPTSMGRSRKEDASEKQIERH
jgi:hypothetical protein